LFPFDTEIARVGNQTKSASKETTDMDNVRAKDRGERPEISSISGNEFQATPDSDAALAEVVRAALVEFNGINRSNGWRVRLEGYTVKITDPDGKPISFEVTLDDATRVMCEHLDKMNRRFSHRRSPRPVR
jgi:hypothetical protein